MLRDLRDGHEALPGACDVCILGAGPAGIVTALELARQRPDLHLVLLEAGGLEPPQVGEDDAYCAESTGEFPYPLEGSRLRYLGGTSNHWGGWCRPLDEEDFARRAWVPRSGWPLTRTQLEPWYRVAARWCEIAHDDYAGREIEAGFGARILPLEDSALLQHRFFRFSPPTRFGTRYRQDLAASENVDLLLHATATGLEWAGARVTGVRVSTGQAARATLRAGQVVVALGGVESTRFLLMQKAAAAPGSGLASPLLGRCFADHYGRTFAGALLPAGLEYDRMDEHPRGPLMPVLCLRREAQEAFRSTNFCLLPAPLPQPPDLGPAYADNAALGLAGSAHWYYRLSMIVEPIPDPESRIVLTDALDALGMPRLRLQWRFSPPDYAPARESLRAVGRELGVLGLGRLQTLPLDQAATGMPGVGMHHLGSARMATDAGEGVVDPQCRVHGTENLHVASSAVFPAFGFSNPTLTIVALAARLARRLAGAQEEADDAAA